MMVCNFDQTIDRCGTDSEKWSRYPREALPLWVADMDFRSPEPIIQALRQRVDHGVFGYGYEPPELREVIIARLQRLYGWRVEPEALLFLPGVVIGFNLTCQALTSPGDGILVQTPGYPPILRAPANAQCTRDEMELTCGADGRYTVDFDRFEGTITKRTRVFLLCNPHNPVGRAFTQEELERMAEICLRHNIVICSDEIHCDFLFRGVRHLPIASLAPEIAERTVTLMAPSKTFNIPGLRFAMGIVPDKELREKLCAAKRGLVGEPDIMSYLAALVAYRDCQCWLDEL
ncbi:MAG: MalY/PatB family protein, partial [Anaerolineae bacterium]